MNLDRTNQSLQVVANVGVILSILLLVFQLSRNEDVMKAQTRNALATESSHLLASEALNADLANIVRRSYDREPLSIDEVFRLERLLQAYFRHWENVDYQYRMGLYDKEEYSQQREAWRVRLARPNVAEFWCGGRAMYSAAFVESVDGLLHVKCMK